MYVAEVMVAGTHRLCLLRPKDEMPCVLKIGKSAIGVECAATTGLSNHVRME